MTVVDEDMRFISKAQHQELQKGHLKANDILITTRGDIGQLALVPEHHVDSNINAQLVRISTTNTGVDHRFLVYAIFSEYAQEQLKNLQTGSALKQLPVGRLIQLQLAFPSPTEQRAIAEALSDVDTLLVALDRLIAKKRHLKRAAMQQLLTGQTRLPGFRGEWEVKTFGDLFNFSGGFSASRDQLSSVGHCYLHYGDIHGATKTFVDVHVDYQDIPKLDIPLKRVSSKSLLEDGDVVFVDASEDDEGASRHIVVMNKDRKPFISGLHTIVAKSKTDELAHEYRRYCFQTAAIRQQFLFYAVGTKVSGISKTNIAKLILPVPSVPEQIAITEVLTDMDTELAVLEQRRKKTRALKQAMMQELLTGRTRLI
jgi:type I restriction enzyme S subunit